VVDIITSIQAHPVAQWLDFVVSSKARSSIDIEVKRHSGDRARIIERGKQALLETFRQAKIPLDEHLSQLSQYIHSAVDKKKIEEFNYQIGQGIVKPSSFLPRKKVKKAPARQHISAVVAPTSVIVGGQKYIPHQLAQCCSPSFPSDIVAVLRTGSKCMIHSADCRNLERVNPQRMLSAYWQVGDK
jgi:GTP pyrophosphokinase